jgi:3-hydroxyisobutyrate dehydrogenase-like beta-hydroxyacid dehydrogenase
MRVGLIGAGMMGHGVAQSLLRNGHALAVIAHRKRANVEDLVAKGASEVQTPADLAARADVIMICVSTAADVAQAVAALRPALRPGHVVIDLSTSQPALSRQLAASLADHGVAFADAPLTGGPEQAAAGTCGVLCGSSPETFATIQPLLADFANTVRHMGPVGAGNTAKLISNYLVTGMIALVAEAFHTAQTSDIAWDSLYAAMLSGSGNSGVLRKMVEPALAGNFDGYRFSLANAAKDIGYYQSLVGEMAGHAPSHLSTAVAEFFAAALAGHDGSAHVSTLLQSGQAERYGARRHHQPTDDARR